MADLNDPLPGSGVSFWPMAAAAVGSLLAQLDYVRANARGRQLQQPDAGHAALQLAGDLQGRDSARRRLTCEEERGRVCSESG